MKFGIICAMPEEIKELTAVLEQPQVKQLGGKKNILKERLMHKMLY